MSGYSDGKVLWSCSEGLEDFDFCLGVARFSGGYVLVDYSRSWLISSEGKVVTCVDVHSRFQVTRTPASPLNSMCPLT